VCFEYGVVLDGAVNGVSMVVFYLPGDEVEGVCEVCENTEERVEECGFVE